MEDRDFCSDCDLGYGQFYHKYFGEIQLLIDVVQRHGLLLKEFACPKCNRRIDYDKRWFWCDSSVVVNRRRKRCHFNVSIFNNTWFSGSRLDIETNLLFVNLYLRDYFSYQVAKDELKLGDKSICD